jgi:predicted N-formylglutamate amidohydrolase
MTSEAALLEPGEPDPVILLHEGGASDFFLACDHAGRAFPRRLERLGLSEEESRRHIAWDIGVGAVGRLLSQRLDAALALQAYSRLVIDCNRDPKVPTSIPEVSENTEIPGNQGLDRSERAARAAAIFRPYHEAIAQALDRRKAAGRASILVALHSFTAVFKGLKRPWHAGVLYNRDPRLARPLLARLSGEEGLFLGDNEPYRVSDETDYTIPRHGERRGLLHVEIEIRQDLIAEAEGQALWAERLARLLPLAYDDFLRESEA